MTRLQYVCERADITALSKEARHYIDNGMPLGEAIVKEYCPRHFGMIAVCEAVNTSCTNCWNEEYRGA